MADDNRLEGIQIRFVSGAMPDDKVLLLGVHGRESLSRLFDFEFVFARPEGPYTDDDLDQLVKAPCALALGPRPGDVVHGLLESIELIDSERHVAARYIARMVPNLWLLTLARTNRLYQQTTVPDLVRTVLTAYGLKEGKNFQILVSRTVKSPKREYVVQYEESDWDFIQRWLEHEGFFYWFSHGDDGEMLVVTDDNADATAIDDPSTISYRERNNLSSGRVSTIWSWNLRQRRIPARVALSDYNYRTPSVPLAVSETVDAKRGFGTVFAYGDHFADKNVGAAIAKLRAERYLCARRTFTGVTDCSRFHVGHSFELENHYDAAFDMKYLITSLDYRVGHPLNPDRSDVGTDPQRYLARFEAIPLDVVYRPERVTPWPKIAGLMHAKIDADASGDYAEIDSQGRYRVRMPFDTSGAKGAKASPLIRMMQPYAGAAYGSHHPLHKGAEVLIGHIDGNPDRPIIVGAAPNPQTQSPSTGANATQSVTQTASGIRIEMEDLQR